jgi:crossover junction endonuclease EME1
MLPNHRTLGDSQDTSFCMDSGQVKTGDGPADTFIRMLQENLRVTAPIAHGIAAEYSTVQLLIKGFQDEGPLALENCLKSANRDGALTNQRVGPAISKRLHSVFTGRDPDSWAI